MSVEVIDMKIAELREDLGNVRGSPCECYQRIVGYYRNVKNWNAGKFEEYGQRAEFGIPATPLTDTPNS